MVPCPLARWTLDRIERRRNVPLCNERAAASMDLKKMRAEAERRKAEASRFLSHAKDPKARELAQSALVSAEKMLVAVGAMERKAGRRDDAPPT